MEEHRRQEVPILNRTLHQPLHILMLSKVFVLNNGLVDLRRMLQKLVALLVFLPVGIAFAQVEPPRLIVRGDDMGYAHAGNVALIQSYKEGIMTSVEVLVPAPWFPEAVKMLAENPGLDVGIHLTLSSEWDNIKWRPISDSPSLTDVDGYFYPMIYPNENYPARSLSEHDWRLEDVEREFRAQIELAQKWIPRLSHISGHMGCTRMHSEIQALVNKLGEEYGINIAPGEQGLTRARYEGPHETSEEKIASFMRMLESLEPGNTYLFVEHPGLDTPEVRAIHHIGYEDVAEDRQGVTDTWTDSRIKALIQRRGIQLISYRELER